MRSGQNSIPAVLILERVDASEFKVLTSSSLEFVSKADKSKETCFPTNESPIKSSRVLISELTPKIKGSLSDLF